MLTPFFTIEPDCMPDARLRLVDAWEAWGVPHDQQLSWWIGLLVWRKEENLTSIKWKRVKYFSGTRFPVLWCVGRKLMGRYRGGCPNPDGVGGGGLMGEERRGRIGVSE